ncbi:hypothetical protein [Dyadobacter jiangsuensis]|uniref:Uncharacterized protein n=1 Tax=Dyadobacter jiangsuensis TaxID=1591085 RepID=A0A2P8FP36_9BACT|nr:hypothetical protein [Dyadobacter jiangsuensis]PSL23492.1 hypothetical protein CLV60_11647 [Dyadobacter jiangsuensis]
MNILQQLHEYNLANPRPEPTPLEVKRFFEGMKYASRVAKGTSRGHIAARAINTEMRTLALHGEQKKVI